MWLSSVKSSFFTKGVLEAFDVIYEILGKIFLISFQTKNLTISKICCCTYIVLFLYIIKLLELSIGLLIIMTKKHACQNYKVHIISKSEA